MIHPQPTPYPNTIMTYFDQDGRPMAVDTTLPVDILEPEDCEAPERVLSAAQFRWLVIRIARTFFTGEPKIRHNREFSG